MISELMFNSTNSRKFQTAYFIFHRRRVVKSQNQQVEKYATLTYKV